MKQEENRQKKKGDAGKQPKASADKKKSFSKGKASRSGERKPWEKMTASAKQTGAAKSSAAAKKTAPASQTAGQFRSFLYLLPQRTSAAELAKTLDFIPKKEVEIWEEECVLEIQSQGGTVTFEDIRDSLEKEDKDVLSELRMKQVIACDYEAADAAMVRKIMESFLKKFGGKIGSDTENFEPFLSLEEI